MDFVLVHSPLVGPSTWRWVAQELEAAGHRVWPVVRQLGAHLDIVTRPTEIAGAIESVASRM